MRRSTGRVLRSGALAVPLAAMLVFSAAPGVALGVSGGVGTVLAVGPGPVCPSTTEC